MSSAPLQLVHHTYPCDHAPYEKILSAEFQTLSLADQRRGVLHPARVATLTRGAQSQGEPGVIAANAVYADHANRFDQLCLDSICCLTKQQREVRLSPVPVRSVAHPRTRT